CLPRVTTQNRQGRVLAALRAAPTLSILGGHAPPPHFRSGSDFRDRSAKALCSKSETNGVKTPATPETETKMTTYSLKSSNFVHTPGIIAWAINGSAFEDDRSRILATICDVFPTVPVEAFRKLLGKETSYKIDGETVVFTVENMREEVKAIVEFNFDCCADSDPDEQLDAIQADLCRLLDADSTTGAACTHHNIISISSEAETYGFPDKQNVPDIQATAIMEAIAETYAHDTQDPQSLIANALGDIRHLCDKLNLSYSKLDRAAYQTYLEEKAQ
ncbi:MAG: hypothetical protein ABJO67_11560, partial [Pseudoruegeria sp.]